MHNEESLDNTTWIVIVDRDQNVIIDHDQNVIIDPDQNVIIDPDQICQFMFDIFLLCFPNEATMFWSIPFTLIKIIFNVHVII